MAATTTSKHRTCGECVACCIYTAIPSLKKQAGVPCAYLKDSISSEFTASGCSNCTAYEARPNDCAGYECLWLQGHGREEDRPDKILMIFDNQPNLHNASICKPLAQGTKEEREERHRVAKRWSHELGVPLLTVEATERRFLAGIIGGPVREGDV